MFYGFSITNSLDAFMSLQFVFFKFIYFLSSSDYMFLWETGVDLSTCGNPPYCPNHKTISFVKYVQMNFLSGCRLDVPVNITAHFLFAVMQQFTLWKQISQ